jgi:hypothetical protein
MTVVSKPSLHGGKATASLGTGAGVSFIEAKDVTGIAELWNEFVLCDGGVKWRMLFRLEDRKILFVWGSGN